MVAEIFIGHAHPEEQSAPAYPSAAPKKEVDPLDRRHRISSTGPTGRTGLCRSIRLTDRRDPRRGIRLTNCPNPPSDIRPTDFTGLPRAAGFTDPHRTTELVGATRAIDPTSTTDRSRPSSHRQHFVCHV
jgi:hypothetical protein